MNPKTLKLRQQDLRRALAPEKRLPSNFTHQTMKHIAATRRAAERRRQRRAVALGFLGWMFGPACVESLRVTLPDADSLVPWLPMGLSFFLLLAFDAWLARRHRSHRP